MLTCYVAALATSAWVMGNALNKITATALTLVPGYTFCVPSGVPSNFYAFWIPMLAFESLLSTLALIRGFQAFKLNGSLFHSGRQLVGILIRDSLMYFFVIFSTYLTCLLVWMLAPTSLLEVPVGFTIAMSCVLCNRVVLNVREVSRDMETTRRQHTSQKQLTHHTVQGSFVTPGNLTDIEMGALRSMKAKSRLSKIAVEERYQNDDELVPVPFIVL
ncbi:hypothetical protein CPC08DRAFT_709544 [Agrocybe pediades]|nr:hypothetical protein CPC08DRAFT_709544 [Agrocybe pediades]